MLTTRHGLVALVLLAGAHVAPALAAESYDNCTGFIETLPATISTQGTWCLKHDVSTAITTGVAITIATNNVTLDCNNFKIGGLAAGDSSATYGVHAFNRQNATIRGCGIRGFERGISLNGGAGHLVEDNRLDNNLHMGIYIAGDNNRVQRNRVYDTGGSPGRSESHGIFVSADVIDNTVSGVFATNATTNPGGIYMSGNSTEARGNIVRNLVAAGGGLSTGINVSGSDVTVDRNRISAVGAGNKGVWGAINTFCTDNTVVHFAIAYDACAAASGNLNLP